MYWLNTDNFSSQEEGNRHVILNIIGGSHQSVMAQLRSVKPPKRWGQASVHANNRLYIIGGYEGTT